MICPRCSIADISDETHQCPLCGFSAASNVIVQQPAADEALETVQAALADRFQIQAVLRLGERSFVYLARELAYDRLVALKVIPVARLVDHELMRRFERQAELAASLRHSHIVPVYTFGAARQFLWYAMEHVRGQSLAETLRSSGPMDLDLCLRIVEQVASALDHAHRLEVTHGNLRPSNVFLDDERWVRVSDFAIREAFGRPQSGDGPVVVMPEYMAPEQFYARSIGASADQYAFAVMVFQCLTGTLPFVGDSFEEVARQQANEPPPRLSDLRPDLPLHVLEAVQRALGKAPASRFPTILDFASALSGARRSRPVTPRRTSGAMAPAVPPPVLLVDEEPAVRRRRRVLIGLAVAALAVPVALAVWQPDAITRVVDSVRGAVTDRAESPPVEWGPLEQAAPPAVPNVTEPRRSAESDPGRVQERTPESRRPPVRSAPQRPAAPSPAAPAVAPGRLFVNATPWGTLFIDGQRIGNTPRANIEVAAGLHRVRVERDGFEPFEREIVVASGQVVRLVDIVLTPKQQ
jgi:serine/threonine-protein kinase